VQACLTVLRSSRGHDGLPAICYMVRKNQIKVRGETDRRNPRPQPCWPIRCCRGRNPDRARVGVKKLIPILAVGGLALGLLASRGQSHGGYGSAAE